MLEEHWLYCIIIKLPNTPRLVVLCRAPPGVSKWGAMISLTCAYIKGRCTVVRSQSDHKFWLVMGCSWSVTSQVIKLSGQYFVSETPFRVSCCLSVRYLNFVYIILSMLSGLYRLNHIIADTKGFPDLWSEQGVPVTVHSSIATKNTSTHWYYYGAPDGSWLMRVRVPTLSRPAFSAIWPLLSHRNSPPGYTHSQDTSRRTCNTTVGHKRSDIPNIIMQHLQCCPETAAQQI